jgi:tetratricopeptide (TPR) repeat protein
MNLDRRTLLPRAPRSRHTSPPTRLAALRGAVALVLVTLAGLSPGPVAAAIDATGRALNERGAFKELRAYVTPRYQANPNDAETVYLMSRVKQVFGDRAKALELAERATQLDPRSGMYRLQVAEVCGQMAQGQGPLKGMSLGKRFKKEAEAALALDPSLLDARVDLMMFYLMAPGIAGGSQKKAEAMAEEIAKLDPAQGHMARARIALDKRDTTRAAESYRQAAQVGASSYDARIAAASFFASRRDWKTAEMHGLAARGIDARRPGGHSIVAIVQAMQERWTDLDATLAGAEAALPGNFGPHYQTARALVLERKEPARAERYLRKFLSVEPEGATPGWSAAHWRLGLALEQRGQTAEAIAEIEKALAMKPDNDDAKKDLKRLKRGRPVASN